MTDKLTQPEIMKALETMIGALRSFQYGNASEEFAKSIADYGDNVLALAKSAAPALPTEPSAAETERDAANATVTALRGALEVLGEQLDFKAGKRRKAWSGSFIDELRSHASASARIAGKPIMGCMKCAGTGIAAGSEALSPCPHCFAGFETDTD